MIDSRIPSGGLKLLKLPKVIAMTGLARSSVYRYCAENHFPKPIRLGRRNVAWVEAEVQEWIEQKIHQRDMAS
ncbi:AlpA family transcriptional regulator [uncultured Amphritea sp.]|uniref:helix-turn-helix transcriptional regulator n=1 Tax=uncultured Amphritea sp. TaxID=981605 RepID=UPI00262BE328|nr:AlpA family transcriptional regulator [uncultured Amphritea sp.]